MRSRAGPPVADQFRASCFNRARMIQHAFPLQPDRRLAYVANPHLSRAGHSGHRDGKRSMTVYPPGVSRRVLGGVLTAGLLAFAVWRRGVGAEPPRAVRRAREMTL